MKTPSLVTFLLALIFFGNTYAQEAVDSELHKTFIQKDSILFEVGFNNCDLIALEKVLAEDLEFYHDVGGIQNKAMFMKTMKENICSSPERKPIRKLTPNTVKVYPLYQNKELYGVIQEGVHEFHIQEPGKELYQTGTALFSILWLKEADDWKAKRIYSYHHQAK
jgi:hypothetical protein